MAVYIFTHTHTRQAHRLLGVRADFGPTGCIAMAQVGGRADLWENSAKASDGPVPFWAPGSGKEGDDAQKHDGHGCSRGFAMSQDAFIELPCIQTAGFSQEVTKSSG